MTTLMTLCAYIEGNSALNRVSFYYDPHITIKNKICAYTSLCVSPRYVEHTKTCVNVCSRKVTSTLPQTPKLTAYLAYLVTSFYAILFFIFIFIFGVDLDF